MAPASAGASFKKGLINIKTLIAIALLLFAAGAQAQYPSGKLENLGIVGDLILGDDDDVFSVFFAGEDSSHYYHLTRADSVSPGVPIFACDPLSSFNAFFMGGSQDYSADIWLGALDPSYTDPSAIPSDTLRSWCFRLSWFVYPLDHQYSYLRIRDYEDRTVINVDPQDSLITVGPAYNLECDNGWTGTWVNAESDTVYVVGGIITDVVSP